MKTKLTSIEILFAMILFLGSCPTIGFGAVDARAGGGYRAPYDFDGDRKSDISVYRGLQAEWWYQRSSDGQVRAFQFGAYPDRPFAARAGRGMSAARPAGH